MCRRLDYVVESVYSELKHQCKQCALRFAQQDKLNAHLDWHFELNKREQLRSKKPLSRQWYLSAEDWLETNGGLTAADKHRTVPFSPLPPSLYSHPL